MFNDGYSGQISIVYFPGLINQKQKRTFKKSGATQAKIIYVTGPWVSSEVDNIIYFSGQGEVLIMLMMAIVKCWTKINIQLKPRLPTWIVKRNILAAHSDTCPCTSSYSAYSQSPNITQWHTIQCMYLINSVLKLWVYNLLLYVSQAILSQLYNLIP